MMCKGSLDQITHTSKALLVWELCDDDAMKLWKYAVFKGCNAVQPMLLNHPTCTYGFGLVY